MALVIGNSAYRSVQALRNPANDAADMAAALSRMGFTVLSKTDLDRKAMRGLIDDFNKAIQGADIALFFYSGHGVQLDGENYLVPVNAEVAVASDVPDECVSLSRITGRMNEAGTKTNVIFLDACRDNPFKAVSRGIERGLAVMGQKPPESVIIYATAENEKAEDGSGRNGTFTAALLKNIESRESLTDIL
ncbi:MAG: caspase family protein, partial [Deltaproteobacteria bacterium]